ncbi:unnamed protein product [Haemonchus placei]|uniref:7TM_GPCR_Srx domain-containing protein n=1 Tax=Haemonchus placei TaxID=6290 RepID=A0A0N4X726_HAEPC|nr:unnamed protein product [Haemonchus placei]
MYSFVSMLSSAIAINRLRRASGDSKQITVILDTSLIACNTFLNVALVKLEI